MRAEIRVRHYSIRTEQTYIDWVRRYIFFHDKRHPQDMGAAEVQAFLSHLAVARNVSASTQNQAKAALLFLYRQVLGIELPWLDEVIAAKAARHLPVVLTPVEARKLLEAMSGTTGLIASLLYGTACVEQGWARRGESAGCVMNNVLCRRARRENDESLFLCNDEQRRHAHPRGTRMCCHFQSRK